MERQELLEKNRGLSRKCLPLHKLFHQHLEKQWKGQEGHQKSEQQRDKIHVTQQHNKIRHFLLYISFVGVYKFLKYSGVMANSCICY